MSSLLKSAINYGQLSEEIEGGMIMKYIKGSGGDRKIQLPDIEIMKVMVDSSMVSHKFLRKTEGHSAVSQRDSRRVILHTDWFYTLYSREK